MAPAAGGDAGQWDGWDDDDWDDALVGVGAPPATGQAAAPAAVQVANGVAPAGRKPCEEDEEDEEDDGHAGDWVCLTEADLEADLAEVEEELPLDTGGAIGGEAVEAKLRDVLRRGEGGAAVDTEVFFAAPRALGAVAAELHDLLAELDALRFGAASLAASAAHGPMRPPGAAVAGAWVGRPAAEVFGLSAAAPLRPPRMDTALPSSATCLADYLKRLEALPRVVVIEQKARLSVGSVDKYQDGKDIGRDSLLVSGLAVSGAQGGYAGAVRAVADAVARAAADGGAAASPLAAPAAAERSAEVLLSVLNRTSSGFTAFVEVLRIFDCQDVVVVSPDSAAARPLELAALGGCALGRAHTRYAVRCGAGDGEPLAVIDAEFSFGVPFTLLAELAAPGAGGAWPARDIDISVLLRRL